MPPRETALGRKGIREVRTSPWYSVKPSDRRVYHDNTLCTEGNNIERENRREGTDGRPRCEHCSRLG
jgi:hypothetical protein